MPPFVIPDPAAVIPDLPLVIPDLYGCLPDSKKNLCCVVKKIGCLLISGLDFVVCLVAQTRPMALMHIR
jgi:hypothetical protein